MAAIFRIDQTGPGVGTADRSRSDLVPGAVINLVVPSPVLGATYSWEILYKVGSTAALTAPTGNSTSVGPGNQIGYFCGFVVELTETIGSVSTKKKRLALVRSQTKSLRPLLHGETSNPTAKRASRSPDDATYNESRSALDGVTGDNSQNWAGWISAFNEVCVLVEQGVVPFRVETDELMSRFAGGNGYELIQIGTHPDPPDGNAGLLYTKTLTGKIELFYRATGDSGPVCLSDGSLGEGGGMTGPEDTTAGALVVWDSADGTLTSEALGTVWDPATSSLAVPVLALPTQAVDPATPTGGNLYVKDDGAGAMLLYYQSNTNVVTRLVSVLGGAAGTAINLYDTDTSDTVSDGMFARFDLAGAGGSLQATLDAAAPIGAVCVVKIHGVAGAFHLDIVDGGAQDIDGVATYTINTNNAAVRLTKMSDTTWAVG